MAAAPIEVSSLKPRVRSLLRLLLLRAGDAVHREQIVDALWPDADLRTGTRGLQTAVSALRQALEPGVARGAAEVLVREGDAYRLVLVGGTTDVRAFEAAAGAAMGGNGIAAGAAARALDLYRGPLFDEEGPAEWVLADRDRLRLRAAEVAESGALAAVEGEQWEVAIRLLERGLEVDRCRDGLWRTLITVHERRGDKAAAARSAQQYELVLSELGITG